MRGNSLGRAAAGLLLLTLAWPVHAIFHLMKIVEVFPGTAAAPSAQYVVIQMYAGGQNIVGGHEIAVFNAAGTPVATFTFPGNVSNGANQAKILIATPQAVSFFGLSADLTMSAAVMSAGGKVCFAGTIDCVAWGAYTGSPAGVGTPFNAAGGLASGRAMIRRLNIAGSATALDAGDDTDNCANDFVSGLPAPRNNAGTLGTIPPATCGNGAIEGLEQCDDGNLSNGDTCSSTCMVQAAPYRAPGDYNADGRSDVFWRHSMAGTNAIWRSANSATPQAVTAVTSTAWRVVGVGDFDASGQADVLWRNLSSGSNVIWLSANFATPLSVTGVTNLSWKVAGVGDFDANGRADILWRNDASGANAIWRNGQFNLALAVTSVPVLSWRIVGVGDFNADGRSDILWRNTSSGSNAIWFSANSATAQTLTAVSDQNWRVAGVGDFDADNRADILWRNAVSGSNVIWRAGVSASPQAVTSVPIVWKIVAIADYDGDRRADILWRNSTTGANAIWRSASSAQPQAVTAVPNLAWTVVPVLP